jgi:hypothetical protein
MTNLFKRVLRWFRKPQSREIDIISLLEAELELHAEAGAMTDGQLAMELVQHVWARFPMYERPSVLIDEAITRLKRADTRARWEQRRIARAAKAAAKPTRTR